MKMSEEMGGKAISEGEGEGKKAREKSKIGGRGGEEKGRVREQ